MKVHRHRQRPMRRREILELRASARAAFEVAVRGRSVALVGGAASLLEHGDGARIDACDVVVRVNWPRDARYVPERTGERTDWHYRASGMPEEAHDVLRKPGCLVTSLKRKHGSTLLPRTGPVALADILRHEPARVYVAGFDLYRSAHSVMPRTKAVVARGHDNELDLAILCELCSDDRVEVDAVLREALGEEAVTEEEAQRVHVQEAEKMIIKRKLRKQKEEADNGLEEMTVKELRDALRELELSTSGDKATLVARLGEALS